MAKPKQDSGTRKLADIGAFALALWFVYSVISNARDLVEHNIKNAPASYGLILTLVLVVWSWYRGGRRLNIWNIITLTILATSAAIWILGLSTSSR